MTTLAEEAKAGFPRLRGAQLNATLPVREALLNQLLARFPVTVEIREHNQISARLWGFTVSAEIVRIQSELEVVLRTSLLSRAALRAVLALKRELNAYVRVDGGLVYVRGGAIPAVEEFRYAWRHITSVRARTLPGILLLDLDLLVR